MTGPGDGAGHWHAVAETDELKALVAARRRFVYPALAVFVVWFGGFLALAGYARDFMGKTPVGDISWAYILALSLIVMTWAIAFAYVRYSSERCARWASAPRNGLAIAGDYMSAAAFLGVSGLIFLSLLSKPEDSRFDELQVRAETGVGAEESAVAAG